VAGLVPGGAGGAARALAVLRTANRAIALCAGVVLLLCAAFILLDVTLRQAGASFGGTDEMSGYVMAAVTTWGLSYALLERAHVRLALVRGRLPGTARALLDLLAILALAAVAVVLAQRAWPVLATSIRNGSRANTVLETPLAIPQSVWFAGLLWFALMACVLSAIAAALVLSRDLRAAEAAVGPPGGAE